MQKVALCCVWVWDSWGSECAAGGFVLCVWDSWGSECCLHVRTYACIYECLYVYAYYIITIIILQDLGLHRPVSALSDSLLKGLPSSLLSFGMYFSIIFGILLLLILVTCCSQFRLCPLSLSSTVSTFISSKMSSFLLWPNSEYSAVLLRNFIDVNRLIAFLKFQNSASI